MRRTFISVTWTPGVSPEDAQTMLRTIEDIYSLLHRRLGRPGQFDPLPAVRVFGAWTVTDAPLGTVYSSIDWYIRHSLDDNRRHVLASRYLRTVLLEPWQGTTPHFDLMLTDLALVDDRAGPVNGPEVLGVSQHGLASLISLKPFGQIANPDLRGLAVRHIVAHYFGHLLGVPRDTRRDDVMSHQGGIYCTATCAMRFTDTPTLALSFSQEQIAGGILYCEACQKDLLAQFVGYHYGLN